MNRLIPVLVLMAISAAAILPGCPGGGGGRKDGGEDGDIPGEGLLISTAGTASVWPIAQAWMTDAGSAIPSMEGLTLRIEEPLKVALDDPEGIFATVTLDATGNFSVANVPVDLVNLGVAAGILDLTDAGRVTRAATILYDVAVLNEKPSADIIQAKAYALPRAFHDQLTAAITPAVILSHTGNQHTTLEGAGFILGQIVDAEGKPVARAEVEPSFSSYESRIYYLTEDLTGTRPRPDGTSDNGVFLYVHTGGEVDTFRFGVKNRPEYLQRNAGAIRDAAVIMTVYPGQTEP
jgi:hypothetical protein